MKHWSQARNLEGSSCIKWFKQSFYRNTLHGVLFSFVYCHSIEDWLTVDQVPFLWKGYEGKWAEKCLPSHYPYLHCSEGLIALAQPPSENTGKLLCSDVIVDMQRGQTPFLLSDDTKQPPLLYEMCGYGAHSGEMLQVQGLITMAMFAQSKKHHHNSVHSFDRGEIHSLFYLQISVSPGI